MTEQSPVAIGADGGRPGGARGWWRTPDGSGMALLGADERLDFERRRLSLRLLLLGGPVLLLVALGAAALPLALGMAAACLGSYVAVRTLLDRFPAVILRWQLALRLVDMLLIGAALRGVTALSGAADFEAVYVLPVLSAAGTHGLGGSLLLSAAAAVLVAAERAQVGGTSGPAFDHMQALAAFFHGVLFFGCGASVVSLMRTSAAVVERRDQAWREELSERNQALERASDQLAATNRELEAFAYSVSHDLRAPLRAIDGFGRVLERSYAEALDERGHDYLRRIRAATQRMGNLIDDLLNLSRLTRAEMRRETIDMSALARTVLDELRSAEPGREVRADVAGGLVAEGDPRLLRVALQNLLGNAWKFTSRQAEARVAFGVELVGAEQVYHVRDNGAGFDMAYADKLFGAFQRLHAAGEFEGTGVGLATVQRIVHRHGGRVWAEGAVGQGATFYFTLG